MTSKNQRRGEPRFRKPLSPEERLNGATYYTREETDRIIKTFKPRQGFDRAAFASQLEDRADFHLKQLAFSRLPALPASQAKRKLAALTKQLSRVQKDLHRLHPLLSPYAPEAGEEIAIREGDRIRVAIWPAEKQLKIAVENIAWLARVTEEASEGLSLEKRLSQLPELRGGPMRNFVQSFRVLFEIWSVVRGTAYKDGITGEVKGNLIDFLKTCLHPLGYQATPEAILGAYDRVRRAGKRIAAAIER